MDLVCRKYKYNKDCKGTSSSFEIFALDLYKEMLFKKHLSCIEEFLRELLLPVMIALFMYRFVESIVIGEFQFVSNAI